MSHNKTFRSNDCVWLETLTLVRCLLILQHGCFGGKKNSHVDCSVLHQEGQMLTPLPESFKPLVLNDEMDKSWFDLIKDFKVTGGRPKNKGEK